MVLINGDCLEALKELESESIDMVFIDPPYGMKYRSKHRKVKYDEILNDDNLDWIPCLFYQLNRVMKTDTSFLCFCNESTISALLLEARKYFKIKKTIVWLKNNHSAGDLVGDFGNKTEFILHFQKGRNKIRGKRLTNVFFYARTGNKLHPTEKPVLLLKELIEKLTDEKQIILDCFMGSGSTGIACQLSNRDFIGIELDNSYFEIAQRRINGC